MKMIRPLALAFIVGITAREQREGPSALTRHAASNCSAVIASTSAKAPAPALKSKVPTSPISARTVAK